MRNVAHRIREHRLRLGWSRPQLAEKLGVSPQYAARLEEAENVTVETLWKLAKALGVLPLAFFTPFEDGESPRPPKASARARKPKRRTAR